MTASTSTPKSRRSNQRLFPDVWEELSGSLTSSSTGARVRHSSRAAGGKIRCKTDRPSSTAETLQPPLPGVRAVCPVKDGAIAVGKVFRLLRLVTGVIYRT